MRPERFDLILDAACREFARKGFERANIAAVAETVGVGKGTIYNYVSSKEELFLAALRRTVHALLDFLRDRVPSDASPVERMEAYLRAHLAFMASHEDNYMLAAAAFYGLAPAVLGKTNRELGFPEQCVELWEDTLRAVLRDGQIHTVECSLPTPRGVREYETRVVPERGPEGSVETFLVIHRNITDRKESERALAERTRQLEAVRAINVEITRELDLGRLLAVMVQRAVELVGGAAGAVILWDEPTQSLVPRAWHGCGEWMADIRLRPGEDLAGAVAAQRRGMLANDYAASAYASSTVLEHASVVAALAEPLVYQDRLPGVLVLYHVEPGRTFTGQHQELLVAPPGPSAPSRTRPRRS